VTTATNRTVSPNETHAVSPGDIEDKMRELADDVDTVTTDIRSVAVTAAAAGLVIVVVVAFWLGRRRGKRSATVVEIRRR
jgi:hypothetical protein